MNELEWLTDRRPDTPAPDEETTARARAALLAHSAGDMPDGARTAAAEPGRAETPRAAERPRRRAGTAGSPRRAEPRKAPLYALAAAVFAVAIIVVAGALPSGDGPTRRIGAPVVAEAAPLVKLSKRIAAEPAPTGDATLVLRSHDFPTAKDFTGADLYLDDGEYFYGMTLAELKASARYGDLGEGVPKLEREAAKAAITLPPEQARRRMIDATFGPGGEPSATNRAPAPNPRKRLPQPTPTPAPKQVIDDNRVWMGAMDTLIAGAGDPEVRAGVMTLLATMPEAVEVTDKGATLELRNTEFGDGYAETLIVDARTGVIQKMVGGYPSKTPDVTVTYDVKRVTASDILGG